MIDPLWGALGYRLVAVRCFAPRLERERPRDRSCTNLSAVARNRERRREANKLWIDDHHMVIYAPPHIIAALRAAVKE